MKKILFSPVSTSDPVSNLRDGPMLHICRLYKPDVVYLYLSKEMCEFHKKDNRYVFALEDLGKRLGHQYKVILKERNELVEVHKFDIFIKDFKDCLSEVIENEGDDIELLLNVSSGTPGMKSALNIISVLNEFPMKPIQVGTPLEKHNPHAEDKVHDDYRLYIEKNDDNDASKFKNRCGVSENAKLLELMEKEMLIKLIQAYDYTGAKILASGISGLSSKSSDLLSGACARVKLDYETANELFRKWEYSLLPIEDEDSKYVSVVEAMLYLDMKLCKEEYADFLRGSTPVILKVFEKVLEKQCDFQVNHYVKEEKNGRKWERSKWEQIEEIRDILQPIVGGTKSKNVYSYQLVEIADKMLHHADLKMKMKQIRKFESETRNEASHEIVTVTKELIEEKSGFTPQEMFEKLKYILGFTDIGVMDWIWITGQNKEIGEITGSYDKMNQILIHEVRQVPERGEAYYV